MKAWIAFMALVAALSVAVVLGAVVSEAMGCAEREATLRAAMVCNQRGCLWTLDDVVRVREALTYYERNCKHAAQP